MPFVITSHWSAEASSPPAAVSRHFDEMPLAMVRPDSIVTVMRLALLSKPTRSATAPRLASLALAASSPPLSSLYALMTARSMGSSFLSGFEQSRPSSKSSEAVRFGKFVPSTSGATQAMSTLMDMLAVVSVPVLSEQSVVIAAMSWSALDDVTTAPWFLAMPEAPMAIVTWMMSGSAMGTDAIMMDNAVRTTSRQSFLNWFRAKPSTKRMMSTNTREKRMR
mmetsp:Transcript_32369/g.100162  ORF Transcript_32369/g.100162 Transcript_32369/m.100162 type:complete len:222 (-) Transcript_32369:842-1507(-)